MNEVTSFTIASVERTNSTELIIAGFGGLTDEVLHGQCAVEENAEAVDSQREGIRNTEYGNFIQ